ncbi:MAG: penicillin-binding protein 2, partial [Proteobacteria bacterium]|nr:penicillin-binding protein 2 [Pseudomonadota bacterium]
VDVDSVWANPRAMRKAGIEPAYATELLSKHLEIDREIVLRRLRSDRYFVWIERRITPRQAAAVRALKLAGIRMSREARRYYPNGRLAPHLLGFTDVDGRGIEGVELKLDDRLRGSSSSVPALRDRRGVVVFSEQLLDDRAAQGDDVYLTIDKTVQRIAERELQLAVRTFEARAGSVVILDPRNGEVLALANHPSFNPNDPGGAPIAYRRNRAVTDRFEPGSTVKPFTVAGALAAGALKPDEEIDCENGALEIAEYTIHDTRKWDRLTPADILKYSSNIGTAKIGMKLGRAGLYRALRRFGFGQRTGLPLPGETAGILRHYRRWYEMDAATVAFGQGMSSTALQLAVATGALANGGRLMKTWLVREIRNARGEALESARPVVRRRVVPEWVARLVGDMLTSVTEPGGTADDASVEGYLAAGKTGTAQKADYERGGYAKDRWTASFVGFLPVHKPRIVVAVVIDEPVIAHYGGKVAGPAFRRIASAALRHLGVPAAHGGGALAKGHRSRQTKVGSRHGAGASSRDAGNANKASLAETIASRRKLAEGQVLVPHLLGASARSAIVATHDVDLKPVVEGSGVVVSQRPSAGSVAEQGSVLRLVLAPLASGDASSEGRPDYGRASSPGTMRRSRSGRLSTSRSRALARSASGAGTPGSAKRLTRRQARPRENQPAHAAVLASVAREPAR